jgi:hypothetical protein
VVVVSGGVGGCMRNGQTAYAAMKYAEFVNLTGGLGVEICDPWASTLNTIGQVAFGLRTIFKLANDADQSLPIEVYVDGMAVTNWTYDAASASVVFNTAPPQGSTIRIVYTPDC